MKVDPGRVPLHHSDNGMETLDLSEAAPLSQFGAYRETLPSGAVSSSRHWHEGEDEFLYLLSGQLTAIDDDGPQELTPGDAVCWRHGEPNAHHLRNDGDAPAVYLIVGSRVQGDICHYPDTGEKQVNGETDWARYDREGVRLSGGDLPGPLLNLSPRWGTTWDGTKLPRVIRKGQAKTDAATPEQAAALGHFTAELLSDTGGLTQFGAFTETLAPGALSSDRHWHENEDEFLYMLAGEATLIEDDGPHPMHPGDAACWKAGVANGHQVINTSDASCTYLIVGTRAENDRAHYSDIDKLYTRQNGTVTRTKRDGSPLD